MYSGRQDHSDVARPDQQTATSRCRSDPLPLHRLQQLAQTISCDWPGSSKRFGWCKSIPHLGKGSCVDEQPRKRLYGEAVKALRITNMIPDGVGFAHGVELHMREQGSTSDVKVALLGTRTPNGHVPQRDFAMSIPILVQHLRPHFPRVCEIRISPTRYASDWFDQCDPWETRPDECVVQLDVDPNFGIPDTPTGTIRQIRYGQKGLFEYAIRPKDHDGFTPDFRVHAICPVSDAKKRWISVNAHQGNMNVDVNPSVTTVLDLCLKHCSIPRDFETIDLICDSPQWVLSDIRILLEGLASRAGGGSVRHFRAATPVTFDRDALRAMLTSTCIADLGMTELDLAADDQPGELALHTHMTAGSLVELVQALPACLSTLSVACIALEQVPSWPESPPGIPPKLSTMHVRFFGIVLQADVINTAYLIARYTEPGCGIWTTSAGGGIPVRHDSEVDYLTDDDDDQNPEAEPYDDDEHEGEDEDEDASDDEPGEEDGEDDQKDVQKAGEALGESDWTYSMAMLRR